VEFEAVGGWVGARLDHARVRRRRGAGEARGDAAGAGGGLEWAHGGMGNQSAVPPPPQTLALPSTGVFPSAAASVA